MIAIFPAVEEIAIKATLGTLVFTLGAVFHEVSRQGDMIAASGKSIRIVSECTPLTPLVLLWGAIWAYPTGLRPKLLGTLIAGVALWSYNTLRIALLIGVLAHAPNLFDLVHVYLWQSLTIVVVAGLFAWWISTLRSTRPA